MEPTAVSSRALADEGVIATTIARRLRAADAEVAARILGRHGKTYSSQLSDARGPVERATAVPEPPDA